MIQRNDILIAICGIMHLFVGLIFLFTAKEHPSSCCWRIPCSPHCSAIFSPVVGSTGGCRRRSLCPECTEEFLNAHPRNGSCLPNSPHQGSGEAAHDSRYRAECSHWPCSGFVLPAPACLWVCSRLLSVFLISKLAGMACCG